MSGKVAATNSAAVPRSAPRSRLFAFVAVISVALAVVVLGVPGGALTCLIFLLIARRRQASTLLVWSLAIIFGLLLCLSALLLADSLFGRIQIELFSIASL